MIIEEANGWLIHKGNVAERATLLTFFTRETGLTRLRMRTSQLIKQNDLIQPFTALWWKSNSRSYGVYLQQIEPLASSLSLLHHYVLAGLYLNELIYHALPVNQPEPLVFASYERSLQALAQQPAAALLEQILRRFEWQLLAACGVLVSFTHTKDHCTAIEPDKYYAFIPESGFVLAEKGFFGAHLLAMVADEWTCPSVLMTGKRVMRAAIDHLLNGVPLHSRRLYRIASCLPRRIHDSIIVKRPSDG